MLVLLLACNTTVTDGPSRPPIDHPVQESHRFARVVIIVLENQDAENVLENPLFADLAAGGASLTDYHGVFHPSYPNYLAMVSGRMIETAGDTVQDVDGTTIAQALEGVGETWGSYAEGFPGDCSLDNSEDSYARRHVPFLSFPTITDDPVECAHVVDADRFDADRAAGALPSYVFYTPDLDDDGHNPVLGPTTGLRKSATWLFGDDGKSGFLAPLLGDPDYMASTVTVITYDESQGTDADNHIYTVLLGDLVVPGEYDEWYNHFSLTRLVEDNFGVAPMSAEDADDGQSDREARRLDPAILGVR
jgi:hypothetical protein